MHAQKFAFRVDANRYIGTGHVMRTLALANELRKRGAECTFICRIMDSNLFQHIRESGFQIVELPYDTDLAPRHDPVKDPFAINWRCDVQSMREVTYNAQYDWVVVDHYGLDARWESAIRSQCRRVMVIDDLANRAHDCDVLLDQTFGRSASEYAGLLPQGSASLCGSEYAMLRRDFSLCREESLRRRKAEPFRRILISMGGADNDNHTLSVLFALKHIPLPEELEVNVVLGQLAPHRASVSAAAADMPWKTNVLFAVEDMASLMSKSDLAVGAAGSTAWERCCLGLPTIMIVTAENQRLIADNLAFAGAARVLSHVGLLETLPAEVAFLMETETRLRMARRASQLVDGNGLNRVVGAVLEKSI